MYLLTTVLGVIAMAAVCQASQSENSARNLTGQPLQRFDLVDGSLKDGVVKLAQEVGGHYGFEEVLRRQRTEPQNTGPHFSLHLANTNLAGVLDALCERDSRYTWSAGQQTINVYPKAIERNSTYLLNRRISRLELKDSPNPDRALFALDTQLPPPREQIGYIEAGGDNAYDAPWSASFSDLTVRQFVNQLAIHLRGATIWCFQGSTEERLFSFARLRLHQQ
jgi:hypothetical protein